MNIKQTKIVAISDIHEQWSNIKIPSGDILLCAGDITYQGHERKIKEFLEWYSSQDIINLVSILGNHELGWERKSKEYIINLFDSYGVTYLDQTSTTINGLKIYGEPRQPEFFNWEFNVPRSKMKEVCWDKVPPGMDIIVTHGPPYGYGDKATRDERVGCEAQTEWIKKYQPKMVVAGHIHEGRGYYWCGKTLIVNAAICNDKYKPINPPIVVTFENGEIVEVNDGIVGWKKE